jgi:hypothetical protein
MTAAHALAEPEWFPILFTGEMVQAILEGQKTQTRRVVNLLDHGRPLFHRIDERGRAVFGDSIPDDPVPLYVRCPYGRPGSRLWVRETLVYGPEEVIMAERVAYRLPNSLPQIRGETPIHVGEECWRYAADRSPVALEADDPNVGAMLSWAHHRERDYCPSIHMPRWASRIALEVLSVGVERVQDITEADANAEGVEQLDGALDVAALCRRAKELGGCPEDSRTWFAELWDMINGKRDGGRLAWAQNPWVWVVEFRRLA